jgi:integrase/recombinase XerD
VNQRIYLINPHNKSVDDFMGFFSIEDIKNLPWKGRTTSRTLLIEPFGSEFWRLLEMYIKTEMILTDQHTLLFQNRNGNPMYDKKGKNRNLRRKFTAACRKIGVDPRGPHSLRHLYGCHCLNYFPREDGTYGLKATTVQLLMGHAQLSSTMKYAIPDLEKLAVEQTIATNMLNGFRTESHKEIIIKLLGKKLRSLEEELKHESIPHE